MVIGLTGGIGSGKSAVAARFAELGVPVLDADTIAREQVLPGAPALADIVGSFGQGVLTADGSLNRAALRDVVFADPARRQQLESILHPRIRAEMRQRMQALHTPYCVLVIPLLLETGQTDMVDRVLVVDAPEDLRIQRVVERDGLIPADIRRILAAQTDTATRRARADDLLDNSGDRAALSRQVDTLHQRYLTLAGSD